MSHPRRGKGKKNTPKNNKTTTTKKSNPDLEKHALNYKKMQQFADMEWKIVGYWRLVESNAPKKERNKLRKSTYCSFLFDFRSFFCISMGK